MSKCHLPVEGWECPREAGHEGPCAAIQADGARTPDAMITALRAGNKTLREKLAAAERERDETREKLTAAERQRDGYLINATPTGCPACAEGICCGSISVPHVNCVYTELAEAREKLEKSQAACLLRVLEYDEIKAKLAEANDLIHSEDGYIASQDMLRDKLAAAELRRDEASENYLECATARDDWEAQAFKMQNERDELIRAFDKAGEALGSTEDWLATPREYLLANAIRKLKVRLDEAHLKAMRDDECIKRITNVGMRAEVECDNLRVTLTAALADNAALREALLDIKQNEMLSGRIWSSAVQTIDKALSARHPGADLLAELQRHREKDSLRTREHNILVTENRDLLARVERMRAAIDAAVDLLDDTGPDSVDVKLTRWHSAREALKP